LFEQSFENIGSGIVDIISLLEAVLVQLLSWQKGWRCCLLY